MKLYLQAILLLLLSICSRWEHGSAAPTAPSNGSKPDREVSNEVEQLDQLRRETEAKQLQASVGNQGQTPAGASTVKSNGGPPSSPRPEDSTRGSSIFRHRGETKKSGLSWEAAKRQEMQDHYAKFAGVQYTPADLAEYIFRTGDEEGVALAVEELVREGMMGRTDAINYLQDVKETLMYMKDQYEKAWRLQEMQKNGQRNLAVAENLSQAPDAQKRGSEISNQPAKTTAAATEGHQAAPVSTSAPEGTNRIQPSTQSTADTEQTNDEHSLFREKQKEAMAKLERLRATNSFYDEYTLEEVIYQLAKDMFAQSMARGDQTAEDTLTRLIAFLESEVDNKRISSDMREKVLEIVSAALVDSLREYPGLVSPDHHLEGARSEYDSSKGFSGFGRGQPDVSKNNSPVSGSNQQQDSSSVSQASPNSPNNSSGDHSVRRQPNAMSSQRA